MVKMKEAHMFVCVCTCVCDMGVGVRAVCCENGEWA